MLFEKLKNRESGIITYGITPPKQQNPHEKIVGISQKQTERIRALDIDALVIYDIQDESDRIKKDRPFPYAPSIDSIVYSEQYLCGIDIPRIIYRCVGKYTPDEILTWIDSDPSTMKYSVFVGAPSSKTDSQLSLPDSYDLVKGKANFLLGGVAIPERNTSQNEEYRRVVNKIAKGCSFFISQVTYNVEAAKNFLSDYYYYCSQNQIDMVPILFTLTPCGSVQTLNFMKWLGISLPRWLENELEHSNDILEKSLSLSLNVYRELMDFSKEKGIPIGCNIESLSVRKVEIDASVFLLNEVRSIVGK